MNRPAVSVVAFDVGACTSPLGAFSIDVAVVMDAVQVGTATIVLDARGVPLDTDLTRVDAALGRCQAELSPDVLRDVGVGVVLAVARVGRTIAHHANVVMAGDSFADLLAMCGHDYAANRRTMSRCIVQFACVPSHLRPLVVMWVADSLTDAAIERGMEAADHRRSRGAIPVCPAGQVYRDFGDYTPGGE